jgi:NAD-dependent DNA ligase
METQISLYKQAIEAYYEGNPIMSDEAFDALESQLLQTGQLSKKLRFEKSNTIEVQHLIDGHIASLPSLPAIHTKSIFDEALYNHIAQNITHTQNLLIMLKYDGMSCEATYDKNGWLRQVVTKGDGVTGYDCTEKWLKCGKIPVHINVLEHRGDIQIRFEAVVKKSEFHKLAELGYKNERNAASGIVKRQDSQFIEHVDPIAYIVTYADANGLLMSGNSLLMSGNTKEILKSFGWNENYIAGQWTANSFQVWQHICETMTNDRDALPYRIDGLVMYPNKPWFSILTNAPGHIWLSFKNP